MAGKVRINTASLMTETQTAPMDLVRAGFSTGMAYKLAAGRSRQISLDMLARLCDFFSARSGRIVGPGEILIYTPDKGLTNDLT